MFYLDQLRDVQNNPVTPLSLSEPSIILALAGLIPAEKPENWRQDVSILDDTEWAEAEGFLWKAIEELTAVSGIIDGGGA